jgi:hypothetical protein
MDKKFILTLLIVIGAVIFVPLIPNEASVDCENTSDTSCDDTSGYVSVYTKYFHK